MRPTDLHAVLEEMFRESLRAGAGVSQKLPGGLHVKVGVRGERRMVILWRGGDRVPGATECEIVGQDAGFYAPKYRSWKVQESDSAVLIQEGYQGELCTHAWGMNVHFDEKNAYGNAAVCQSCGGSWRRQVPRRGKAAEVYLYNGQKIRHSVLQRWVERGPVPGVGALRDPDAEAVREFGAVLRQAGPTSLPAEEPDAAPLAPEQAKREQEARDAAEKAHLIGLLTCVMLHHAAVNPWFRQGHVIAARRKFLKDAALEDLREECRGRLFAWAFPAARPYVFLVVHWASYGARWRHAHRALPVKATAARKARKPRTPRKAVAAA